jgi:hypothetical protein
MAAPKKYNATAKGLMMWASHELEHVGRVIAVEDPDIQYSYAMSTLNGMAHLKDALFEYISDNPDSNWIHDLLITHDKVVRVMKHLIKDFTLQIGEIEAFNTHKVLSSLNYLKEESNTNMGRVANANMGPMSNTNMGQMANTNKPMKGGRRTVRRRRRFSRKH